MSDGKFFSRGFFGRRKAQDPDGRIPPGQTVTTDFPVLTAGPTWRPKKEEWTFTIEGEVDAPVSWDWDAFRALPREEFVVDIHCVTKWSKLDTSWEGVRVDTFLDAVELGPDAAHVMAYSTGGYTTNIPITDLVNGQAFIADRFGGKPLTAEHGGPVRLVVPHLYFWKSAKWLAGFRVMNDEELGFWERVGYHRRGDPFKEERYDGD